MDFTMTATSLKKQLAVASLLILPVSPLVAEDISIGLFRFVTIAHEVGEATTYAREDTQPIPFGPVIDSHSSGGSSNTTTYQASGTDPIVFDFDFQHERAGIALSYADSEGRIEFAIDGPDSLDYAIDGSYDLQLQDVTSEALVWLEVRLNDVTGLVNPGQTAGDTVFFNRQVVQGGSSVQLDVGAGGWVIGSSMGTLEAGHSYIFSYQYRIRNQRLDGSTPPDDGGALAIGNLTFAMGRPGPVDTDGDGVPDDEDEFPNSNTDPDIYLSNLVMENIQLENGATLADEIEFAIANDVDNVETVHFLVELKASGLISGREMGAILREINTAD